MIALFLFCAIGLILLTAYRKYSGKSGILLIFGQFLLMMIPTVAAVAVYMQGFVAVAAGILAGIIVSLASISTDNQCWIKGIFASGLLIPGGVFILYLTARLLDWQMVLEWRDNPTMQTLGNFMQGYCAMLLGFMPMVNHWRDIAD